MLKKNTLISTLFKQFFSIKTFTTKGTHTQYSVIFRKTFYYAISGFS